MGIIDYAKLASRKEDEQKALLEYVQSVDSACESDVSARLHGVKNKTNSGLKRAGYVKLREFFEGDQWEFVKEDGSAMRTHNFCRSTVLNYTAFLANEPPETDIPPRDPRDDIELARVKEVEGIVTEILDDNDFGNQFETAIQVGSITGDSFITGPFWDEKEGRVWFKAVKKPEHIRVIWSDENHGEIIGYIIHMRLTPEQAMSEYGEFFRKNKIDPRAVAQIPLSGVTRQDTSANTPMQKYVDVIQFWDDTHELTTIAGKVESFSRHNYGFVSLLYVPNIPHPTEWNGISDIEDMLDPQVEYNEAVSDQSDILKQVAFATIFGKNLDIEEIEAGVSKIYDLGDDAEVFSDPRNTNYPFLQGFLSTRRADVTSASGLNDLFTGGSEKVFRATGRALSVIMQPITNRVQSKQRRWKKALRTLVKNILILVERNVEGADALIDGHYDCDIFFSSTLVRDITDELNKMVQKTQSQYTTMKNLGIPSPSDEQELMKKELEDPQLMIELSRSPQMHQQMRMMMEQKQAAAVKAQQGPMLSEGENTGEGVTSAPGVPNQAAIPQEALAALMASRGGAPPLIPNQ